jgi:hypothetical protein
MKILAIDVGIINLGYVYAELVIDEPTDGSKYKNLLLNSIYNEDQFTKKCKVIDCNRIDIRKIKHRKVPFCVCKLHHDNCVPDYLDHFIQELPHFNDCDILIIERQPPMGIMNVQDLLFKLFRDKVLLISPNSMHKYFKLSSDYNERKKQSEELSLDYLTDFENFNKQIRRHDISDAMLMIIYYYKISLDTLIKNTTKVNNILDDFEKFKFNVI